MNNKDNYNKQNEQSQKNVNNSREFWAEVEKYCPDYKQRKKQLKSL